MQKILMYTIIIHNFVILAQTPSRDILLVNVKSASIKITMMLCKFGRTVIKSEREVLSKALATYKYQLNIPRRLI